MTLRADLSKELNDTLVKSWVNAQSRTVQDVVRSRRLTSFAQSLPPITALWLTISLVSFFLLHLILPENSHFRSSSFGLVFLVLVFGQVLLFCAGGLFLVTFRQHKYRSIDLEICNDLAELEELISPRKLTALPVEEQGLRAFLNASLTDVAQNILICETGMDNLGLSFDTRANYAIRRKELKDTFLHLWKILIRFGFAEAVPYYYNRAKSNQARLL